MGGFFGPKGGVSVTINFQENFSKKGVLIFIDMKYIMTPEQAKLMMDDILKRKNIKVDIVYWNDNGRDSITGTVYLYKDYQILGYKHGYEFFFHYDNRFNKLTPKGTTLNQKLDFFKMLPNEVVVQYFTDRVQNYLEGFIDGGFSNLRRS